VRVWFRGDGCLDRQTLALNDAEEMGSPSMTIIRDQQCWISNAPHTNQHSTVFNFNLTTSTL
jgi:hypothetical protein